MSVEKTTKILLENYGTVVVLIGDNEWERSQNMLQYIIALALSQAPQQAQLKDIAEAFDYKWTGNPATKYIKQVKDSDPTDGSYRLMNGIYFCMVKQ